MKSLYVIFVNYNSDNQLYMGVQSVLKSHSVTGIIIVDNASKDESLKLIYKLKDLSRVIILKNKKNLGFYKALNIAIRKAFELKADMIMPLDFDLDFSFDFISKLLKTDGDIVAPVLKFKKAGRWFYDYGGRMNWLTGNPSHLISAHPFNNFGGESPSFDHTNPYWYDFVSGGCTIIKTKVIEKIGNFDEDYFVYFGDADYVLHARDAGFKIVLDGNTIVHHKIEFATETRNIRKLKISFFDNLKFIRKRVKWYFAPIAYAHIFWLSLKVFLKTYA